MHKKSIVFLLSICLILIIIQSTACSPTYESCILDLSTEKFHEKTTNKDSFTVYIGRPTCPDCERFLPLLKECIDNENSIYYFNTDDNREKNGYDSLIDLYKVESVPVIITIEDGKEVNRLDFTEDKKKIEEYLSGGIQK